MLLFKRLRFPSNRLGYLIFLYYNLKASTLHINNHRPGGCHPALQALQVHVRKRDSHVRLFQEARLLFH
jgi:hypothetical protein